jgi:hypothetical protein
LFSLIFDYCKKQKIQLSIKEEFCTKESFLLIGNGVAEIKIQLQLKQKEVDGLFHWRA